MTNWKKEIDSTLANLNEKLIACTLTDEEMTRSFDPDFGGSEGTPFTAWTKNYVLFPVVYDGAEWVGCAHRHPCDKATEHQGGE